MYIRVSQNAPFSVKHSMTGGKRKLEWRRVRKYIRFLILFIPRASNCKNPFRGFSEILLHNISYEFTSFSIFWPKQKIRKFFLMIPYWLRSIKKSAHAHNVFFGFGFWALLARIVDEIENSRSKIILYLPHASFARYHRIFIFLGHPNVHWATNVIKKVQQ